MSKIAPMRSLIIAFVLIFFQQISHGQFLKPIKWEISTSTKEFRSGDEIDLIFKAIIDKNWYLYSSDFDPDLGPTVTQFSFEPHESFELVGDVKPIEPKKKYDEIWEGEYTYFKGTGEFRQTIKILKESPVINGFYAYQVCSDVDGKCIPFDHDFTAADFGLVSQVVNPEPNLDDIQKEPEGQIDQEASEGSLLKQRDTSSPYSLLVFMIGAFLAGFLALLTPCVYPMIPMTISLFSSHGENKKRAMGYGAFYGLSIIGIFTLLGTIVSIAFGADFANWISTHWVPNLIFFVLFIVFAISFFGMFEITLPSGLVNKIDREADKGGLYGVFFMAFTLSVVSFSCTGPIVGSLLVEASGGHFLKPILGMFAFSLAFAIPFTFFALFPSWVSSLPKSGGWLNSVKITLGFLELAFAFKFLSIADLAYHWNLLNRDLFLTIWIVIFGILGFYLLGKIKLSGDTNDTIPVPRLILSIAVLSFVLYMIPGLWGAPLKGLSGFLPPVTTQEFSLVNNNLASSYDNEICEDPKYDDFLHLPHGLNGYFDYEQAVACSKDQNKPVFIDFTGHGCVNCREMEQKVWSDPQVIQRLSEDYVVVALYVDDRKTMAKNDWYTSKEDGKLKKTIGKKNADIQISKFKNNAQPFYVLLGADEEPLLDPKGYDLSVSNFVNYLDKGKKEFELKFSENIAAIR